MATDELFDPYPITVDEETGEIITPSEPPTPQELPRLARTMRAVRAVYTAKIEALTVEISRLEEIRMAEAAKMDKAESWVRGLAEMTITGAGLDAYELPGVGKFSWRKGRESVDTSKYDALSEEDKAGIQSEFAELFRTQIAITPDKKIIAASSHLPQVFSVTVGEDKFVFTEK